MAAQYATRMDIVLNDGASRLLRAPRAASSNGAALLVPSMLQRWHILDLRKEASLVRALSEKGLDVFVLDWGELGSDTRLAFDEAVGRVSRALRQVVRLTGKSRPALVGYSQGATLAAIVAALEPSRVGALVNLAGPIDFSVQGVLSPLTDARMVDVDALADAGGAPAGIFRGLVAALHPGATALSAMSAIAHPNEDIRRSFAALERWADDPVPLPPEVLRVWVKRLYQENALLSGRLSVCGRRVNLGAVTASVLVVTAERDTICPEKASTALLTHVSSATRRHLVVPGGHVSGIAGPTSREFVHLPVGDWLVSEENVSAA
jgi:polyhydroxyalkanoate synthase